MLSGRELPIFQIMLPPPAEGVRVQLYQVHKKVLFCVHSIQVQEVKIYTHDWEILPSTNPNEDSRIYAFRILYASLITLYPPQIPWRIVIHVLNINFWIIEDGMVVPLLEETWKMCAMYVRKEWIFMLLHFIWIWISGTWV